MFAEENGREKTISEIVPEFLLFTEVKKDRSKETIVKCRDCLRQIQKHCGDLPVERFSESDLFRLERAMHAKDLSVSRRTSILLALKSFLRYLRDQKHLTVFDPEKIEIPKRKRNQHVVYLTPDEVERFVSAIKITNYRGGVYAAGLRFRALVEALLGSAMRISEVLSLNRDQIDLKSAEAMIIGKGGKKRPVFFTDRALHWIQEYLKTRTDDYPALFVCQDGRTRLKRTDVWRPFTRYRLLAGIAKKDTPHLLRHTAATQLLFNGCPVGHIKEILGHRLLETTCEFYLGLDHRAAKAAHRKYLVYSPEAA